PCIDAFLTVDDADATLAMRALAAGVDGDVPVLAGESGAAGHAGLAVLMRDRALAARAGLDANSRVVLINTEGATAPGVYASLTGEAAEAVIARRQAWLDDAARLPLDA
ncbi:diaminopropionate ammonia-lyase, partial [Burkholderia gladioli]